MSSTPSDDRERYERARRRVRELRGFYVHATVFVAVNILLHIINFATSPGMYWAFWPLLGWGIGLLAHALANQLRCVRIIHGKGKNSGPRGPVIKTAVNMILRKTGPVLAFTSARRVDGGTGAINVLLGSVPLSASS